MNVEDINARYLEVTASGIRSHGMVEQDDLGWAIYKCGPLGGGSWHRISAERVPGLRKAFIKEAEAAIAQTTAMERNAERERESATHEGSPPTVTDSQPIPAKQLTVHEQIARDEMKPVAVETTTATPAKTLVLWMPPTHATAKPIDHWRSVVARYNGRPEPTVPKGWERTIADAQARVAIERGEAPKLSHGWDRVVAKHKAEATQAAPAK